MVYEKEALGFYITGHPLLRYQEELKKYATSDTLSIANRKEGEKIRIGGLVRTLKEINTKKGERMAFVTLEDHKGSIEVVVFSDLYKEVMQLIKSEEPLLVDGDLKEEEEKIKVIAKEIIYLSEAGESKALEEVSSPPPSAIHFNIEVSHVNRERLEKVKAILQQHPGECQPFFHLIIPGESETIIYLPDSFKLDPSFALQQKIKEVFEDEITIST